MLEKHISFITTLLLCGGNHILWTKSHITWEGIHYERWNMWLSENAYLTSKIYPREMRTCRIIWKETNWRQLDATVESLPENSRKSSDSDIEVHDHQHIEYDQMRFIFQHSSLEASKLLSLMLQDLNTIGEKPFMLESKRSSIVDMTSSSMRYRFLGNSFLMLGNRRLSVGPKSEI